MNVKGLIKYILLALVHAARVLTWFFSLLFNV